MNLCSENHEEVCHEGRECPCCLKVEEIKQLEEEISKLNDKIEELTNE